MPVAVSDAAPDAADDEAPTLFEAVGLIDGAAVPGLALVEVAAGVLLAGVVVVGALLTVVGVVAVGAFLPAVGVVDVAEATSGASEVVRLARTIAPTTMPTARLRDRCERGKATGVSCRPLPRARG